jgi:cathepsin B
MNKLVLVGTILGLSAAIDHPIRREIVAEIRSKATWAAHDPATNPMANKSIDEIKAMLGATLTQDNSVDYKPSTVIATPASYDSRTTNCVHPIRDQQSCGSCWAFAGSETLSDRFCIASKGAIDVVLSPEDLVACNTMNQGCNGGILALEWKYMENYGIVTDSCFAYSSGKGVVPTCASKCEDGSEFMKYKCVKGSTVKATTVEEIKSEIVANGPMETGFTVYEDFMNYESGVYYHVSGDQLGGHAVKIVGYGHDEVTGHDFWICANSWNTTWGE